MQGRSWVGRVLRRMALGIVMLVLASVSMGAAAAPQRASVNVEASTLAGAVPAAASAPSPGYALEHFKWVDRTVVQVFYNWDGGSCVLNANDLSGPASAIAPATALASLDASIKQINAGLKGGLTLVDAGPTTRAVLCSQDTSHAIVLGFGQIAQTGLTFSFGLTSTTNPGWSNFEDARVFLNNTYNFACSGTPQYRDLQHTMTHELLHAIGIGHSSDPTAIMAPTGIACETPYLLQPDDLVALASLYPPPPGTPTTSTPAPTTVTGFDRPIASTGVNAALWSGGTVSALATATTAAGGVSVTVFVRGSAVVMIPGAPAFVNAAFTLAFPTQVPSGTIVLVVR